MGTRLVTDVLRRFAVVWSLGLVLLALWQRATAVVAGPEPDGAAERAGYLFVTSTLSMLMAILASQAVTFVALRNRAVRVLPVSRRDLWRARWMIVTLGAATLTTAAQALIMVVATTIAPAASNAFASLAVTWWSTFILGGVWVAIGLWAPGLIDVLPLPAATGVFRNLLTLAARFLRNVMTACVWLLLAVVFIMGATELPGLLRRCVTMDWHDLSHWHGLATGLAVFVAVASYWHRPPVQAGPGRPPVPRPCQVTLIPRGTLSAVRLLVYENFVRASLGAAIALGVVGGVMVAFLMFVRDRPYGEAIAGVAVRLAHQLDVTNVDGLRPLFFGFLLGQSEGKFNARHLRALPISTLQLTALLLLPTPLMWLAVITLVSGLHLAVIGTMPRIDPSLLAVILGITALYQPLRLQMRGLSLGLCVCLLILLVPGTAFQPHLPDAPAPLTPITFGVLLTAIAIVWSYWLLTRSSRPFRRDFLTAWTEG